MGEEKFKQEMLLKKHKTARRIILAAIVLLVIGVPTFFVFKLRTEGRNALREAKNVNLAFQMISVEYYGMGVSIYDPSSASGLADGVKSRLSEVVENEFEVLVTGYDKTSRAITSFEYTNEYYLVKYKYDTEKGDTWKVYYKYLVYDYDGE